MFLGDALKRAPTSEEEVRPAAGDGSGLECADGEVRGIQAKAAVRPEVGRQLFSARQRVGIPFR